MRDVLALEALTLAAGPIQLLREISLTVRAGQTVGLVGESGAGKSMIGRLVSGLVPPGFAITAGRLLFEGVDLTHQKPAQRRALLGRRIAFIPQEPLSALNPVLSIGRQFGEHLARLSVPASQAVHWLDAVHLPDPNAMLKRYPHELSGGQCQRVLIAMAFSSEPALIVADEPTTALDVLTQGRILRLLKEQQDRHGAAVLLITHDLQMAARVCDEVAVLYGGDMIERGPAETVLRRPVHPYTISLRNSAPSLEGPRTTLPNLPDQMPSLSALAGLSGCRFAPRCPTRACADLPTWRDLGGGHAVRCAPACAGTAAAIDPDTPAPGRPASSGVVLELADVSLRYPGRRSLWGHAGAGVDAVRHVNLRVAPGEFVGIVGESGSGKSSIARLVMGLEQPTTGSISRPDGNKVQIVFQDPQSALNPRRSVLSLVTQALEAGHQPVPSRERLAIARRLLDETGLPEACLPRVPSQLSGGQRQRVNIARALCVLPNLLVADEIVSGLDVSVQAQVLNLLLRLGREHGTSLLFISHDLAVVRYLCSRVAVMQRGEIVETGVTEMVFSRPEHPYTRALLDGVREKVHAA
jgi:peptide/nickel transport system ATP-binding protein